MGNLRRKLLVGCDGIEQGEMGHLGKKYWVVWTMGWIWIEKDGLRHLRRIHETG